MNLCCRPDERIPAAVIAPRIAPCPQARHLNGVCFSPGRWRSLHVSMVAADRFVHPRLLGGLLSPRAPLPGRATSIPRPRWKGTVLAGGKSRPVGFVAVPAEQGGDFAGQDDHIADRETRSPTSSNRAGRNAATRHCSKRSACWPSGSSPGPPVPGNRPRHPGFRAGACPDRQGQGPRSITSRPPRTPSATSRRCCGRQGRGGARLSSNALQQYGGSDVADQLGPLKRQADAVALARPTTAQPQARLLREAQAAIGDRNLRVALIAFEQALQTGRRPAGIRRQYDEVCRPSALRREGAQAGQLRRDPSRIEEAIAALEEARRPGTLPRCAWTWTNTTSRSRNVAIG